MANHRALVSILRYGTIAGVLVGGILFATTVSMADQPPSMGIGMAIGTTFGRIAGEEAARRVRA